eukprot:9319920-Pyramimonas_sp.AAC.1
MLPTAGALELTIVPAVPVDPPPRRHPMTAETFQFMWEEVIQRDTPKNWVRQYITLLGKELWFTCEQVRCPSAIFITS